jgi:uncharacterized coiled-coil protein SlyX
MNIKQATDEELFESLREQVNMSRNYGTHNREKTRELAEEMRKRGFSLNAKAKEKGSHRGA